jgi:hypothetical protein
MKIIAFYLPQFHNIPENNEWWGDGFTEWVNVKKAKPLYEGHDQPRVPLNNNYYNLLDDNVKVWQAELAKKYGIYGFSYYHYWFNGKLLLEKPMEQMLENKAIDIPFCISWANETWTKAWTGDEKKVLILQKYGKEKEWREHFEYLLPFFKDQRYIKVDGKPFFIIYRPEVILCLNQMLDLWNNMAIENGFPGMSFAYQSNDIDLIKGSDDSRFDYDIEFQPDFTTSAIRNDKFKTLRAIRRSVAHFVEKHSGIDLYRFGRAELTKIMKKDRMSFDEVWENILKTKPASKKNLPGAFVGWDNSPRHDDRATIYVGDSPEKFEKYITQQVKRAREVYHTDMLFMYAWNEWAEGGYLEPDERSGYRNLEAIRNALIANGEFPDYRI